MSEIVDRFGRGQRAAVDEATSFWEQAVKIGSKLGSDAIEQIGAQTKKRPLVTLAVAVGVGILIGMARSQEDRIISAIRFFRLRVLLIFR